MRMSYCYKQYPDLTEIGCYEVLHTNFQKEIDTEFVFYLRAIGSAGYATPENYGFKLVSSMNNWWPSHYGEERRLDLFWMKLPEKPDFSAREVYRVKWSYGRACNTNYLKAHEKHMAKSGCGLKIGEPPFKATLFHRFFTLMRLPVELKPSQTKWLKLHNYRFLDSGKEAQYWVNGWPPEEYSMEKEYEFFKTSKAEWAAKGLDGY